MVKGYYSIFLLFIFFSCEEPEVSDSTSGKENYEQTFVGSHDSGSDQTNGEKYNYIEENPFYLTKTNNISTFSIDADGASYSNVRRYINEGMVPPKNAIRTEELVNYFTYDYPEPDQGNHVSLHSEVTECPWQPGHNLLRIGIKGKYVEKENMPPANLVLLVDVSGSMSMEGKLDLLKESFSLLVENLRPEDKIAIVTYAGKAGIVLAATSGEKKDTILAVLNNLEAAGSTAGAQGIETAYSIASENFIRHGNNRVIVATDGDFNVGPSSQQELVELIRQKKETGIYLTILGVGQGNLNDALMEQTANNGNGNYEYLDSYEQADKVFNVEYCRFYSVATDVKVQVEFNTDLVESYRLIGYENRRLTENDFNDDSKDAGEIGSGQTITALYEFVPKATDFGHMATIGLKYKETGKSEEYEIVDHVNNSVLPFAESSENMRFASAVCAFAMKIRNSIYLGDVDYDEIVEWANSSREFDPKSYRHGFVELVVNYIEMDYNE